MLKLNLGSGKDNKEDYINIDAVKHTEATVVGDILNLDYEDNTVDIIFSSHVIEHFTKSELNRFFSESARMLRNKGELEIIAPCMNSAIADYCAGNISISYLHDFLFACQNHVYDFHKQGIYREKLEALCEEYGFILTDLYNQSRDHSKYELVMKAILNKEL